MFHTGLDRYITATVDNFTSDFGINIRRLVNTPWRAILKCCTKRRIVLENYPHLDKDKPYIFVANHSFDEDAISVLASIDRNVYMLQGTTDQTLHNPVFLAMWANGMIYVNRLDAESRKAAIEKMKRILRMGSSVVLFAEGGYNNTENQLIQPLFSSPYILCKELGVKVVPLITFNDIEPVICFTKLDLLNDKERIEIDKYIDYYRSIGYVVVTNESKDNFTNLFKDKITVLTGQSGAGKSSLLNLLDSDLNLKTDEISLALNRGKHTTRHTELYEVMDGFIVDTPGFSSVDFRGMTIYDIRDNMKEMFDNLHECKYRDCMHVKEDGCRVKEMVEDNVILLSRYDNYKYFVESVNKVDVK